MGKNDIIGGGLFMSLGIAVWVLTFGFPVLMEGNVRHPGPSLFPRVLATLFIFFGLLVALKGIKSVKTKTVSSGEAGPKPNYFNPVLVIVLIAAFVFFTPKLGFLLTGTVILAVLMKKLGVGLIKGVLISSFLNGFVYFTFVTILKVPLPRGLFGW